MKKILPILFLSLIAHEAWAVNWVMAGGTSQLEAYLDTSSIRQVGNLVQYWEKYKFKTPAQATYFPFKNMSSLVAQFRVNCATQELLEFYEVAYFADGTSASHGPNDRFAPAPPGSLNDLVSQYACAHVKAADKKVR